MKYTALLLVLAFAGPAAAEQAPYPPSKAIGGITLDWSTHKRDAQGSDNWQLTWADDGHQYAAWGDGGGFGGTNSDGRVSLGVARVEGPWNDYKGVNVWGGKNPLNKAAFPGKSWGMVCVKGVLYMWVVLKSLLADMQSEARLYLSKDHAATWEPAPWAFTRQDALTIPTICQYGRDYQGARDSYVYHYFIRPAGNEGYRIQRPGAIYLLRSPAGRLMEREAYEFFAGLRNGKPVWSRDVSAKRPVFEDANGVDWVSSVSYNPGLKRYILMTSHTESSGGRWGVFDAAAPWGPWTTVTYLSEDSPFGAGHVEPNTFFWNMPVKWLDKDGRGFTLVFTGAGRGKDNDSFNLVRGRFDLR